MEFLKRHDLLVLFLWVLAEQFGLPLPAIPMLLAVGALARTGGTSLPLAIVVALAAALIADLAWFELGRRRGTKILNLLCRVSLEPDSCVRRTEEVFAKHGAKSLLFSKFLPGLSTVAPPLAGMFRVRLSRFLLFDGLGTLAWAGGFLLLGYAFGNQIDRIVRSASQFGGGLARLIAATLTVYLVFKFASRQLFLRTLRVARIRPEELKARIEAGEPIVIVDMRSSIDFEAEPESIPGARRVDREELVETHHTIPRDQDVVLFCT